MSVEKFVMIVIKKIYEINKMWHTRYVPSAYKKYWQLNQPYVTDLYDLCLRFGVAYV